MFNSNNIYCASAIDTCQQTLDVVADNASFFSKKFSKWMENSLMMLKILKLHLRKDINFYRRKLYFVLFVGLKILLKMVAGVV